MQRVILSKLDCLVDHYFNSTKGDSWKYDRFKMLLEDKVFTDTEEELVFKCLLYIYQDFVDYLFAFDVSECLMLLRNTLNNNKSTRTWYKKVRLLEQYCRGVVITDKVVINLLIEQVEHLIHRNLDRMMGRKWKPLDRPVDIENPIKKQLSQIEINNELRPHND